MIIHLFYLPAWSWAYQEVIDPFLLTLQKTKKKNAPKRLDQIFVVTMKVSALDTLFVTFPDTVGTYVAESFG